MDCEIKGPDELQTLSSFNYQELSFPNDPNIRDLLCREVLPVTPGPEPGAALMLPGALSLAMKQGVELYSPVFQSQQLPVSCQICLVRVDSTL